MDRVGRAGTHQEEGTHSRDLVELHQQAQGLLVVAAVLLIHTELVLLQDKGRAVSRWAQVRVCLSLAACVTCDLLAIGRSPSQT